MPMNRIAMLLASVFLLAGIATAQENAPREKVRTFTFTQNEPVTVYSPNLDMMMFQREPMPDRAKVEFFSSELVAGGEVITGAPYTATAVTESTQTLADGNRIVDKNSSFIARDGQGRTRREMTLHRIGTLDMNSPKTTYFINDPVTHTQYVVTGNEATKIVRSEGTWNQGPPIITTRRIEQNGVVSTIETKHALSEKLPAGKWEEVSRDVKHEDLGTQTIEGVTAEGRRETVTIPAGQIGNERPIEIVTEIWTSPELHTVVLRKHSDPRTGETIFHLTDIKRGEPDAALFQPPPGAKIKSEQMLELKREPAPPKD
jgi:hypothetical protein